jgi:CheY-like chemotaxis protein
MIVVCPDCERRYKTPDDGSPSRRVRCRACGRVFTTEEGSRPRDSVTSSREGAASVAARPPRGGVPPPLLRPGMGGRPARGAPLALVGDEDREFRSLVRRTLESLGCKVEVTGDGEAAFRFAVAHHPDLMVLNVYLTRLLGVAVCEGVKGSPDLKTTRVALVGSVFKSDRFVRHPGNLYGADDYFEDVIPEAQLRGRLSALLGAVPAASGSKRSPGPAAVRADPLDDADFGSAAVTAATVPAPLAANGADEPIDPRSEIHRLARIMVSDLKIYNPDEFRRAVLERRFSETFREELTQAKDLVGRRFPDMPDRMAVLAEALKEEIAVERAAVSRPSVGFPS